MKTVDASVLIDLLLEPEAFIEHRAELDDALIAPAILIPEVLNGIKKAFLSKRVSRLEANKAAKHFESLRIDLVTLSAFRKEMWTMINNFSTYDAAYLLVARHTNTPLITADARLAKASPRDIEVVLLR